MEPAGKLFVFASGSPIKVYVEETCEDRDVVQMQIKKFGGKLVDSMFQAKVILLDAEPRSIAQRPHHLRLMAKVVHQSVLSTRWVKISVMNRELPDFGEWEVLDPGLYQIGPDAFDKSEGHRLYQPYFQLFHSPFVLPPRVGEPEAGLSTISSPLVSPELLYTPKSKKKAKRSNCTSTRRSSKNKASLLVESPLVRKKKKRKVDASASGAVNPTIESQFGAITEDIKWLAGQLKTTSKSSPGFGFWVSLAQKNHSRNASEWVEYWKKNQNVIEWLMGSPYPLPSSPSTKRSFQPVTDFGGCNLSPSNYGEEDSNNSENGDLVYSGRPYHYGKSCKTNDSAILVPPPKLDTSEYHTPLRRHIIPPNEDISKFIPYGRGTSLVPKNLLPESIPPFPPPITPNPPLLLPQRLSKSSRTSSDQRQCSSERYSVIRIESSEDGNDEPSSSSRSKPFSRTTLGKGKSEGLVSLKKVVDSSRFEVISSDEDVPLPSGVVNL